MLPLLNSHLYFRSCRKEKKWEGEFVVSICILSPMQNLLKRFLPCFFLFLCLVSFPFWNILSTISPLLYWDSSGVVGIFPFLFLLASWFHRRLCEEGDNTTYIDLTLCLSMQREDLEAWIVMVALGVFLETGILPATAFYKFECSAVKSGMTFFKKLCIFSADSINYVQIKYDF